MTRRKLTMDFDSLEAELQDDDDSFFESRDRLSTAVPFDLDVEDDGDFEDSRMSFASAINSASIKRIYSIQGISNPDNTPPPIMPSYDMWMAEPGDLKERRKRLLQGMGLASNRDLLKIGSNKVVRSVSRKPEPAPKPKTTPKSEPTSDSEKNNESAAPSEEQTPADSPSPEPPPGAILGRSRSDSDVEALSAKTKQRKEELIGSMSKQRLTRTLSGQLAPTPVASPYASFFKVSPARRERNNKASAENTDVSLITDDALGSFFLIKNLDTGSDFIVQEYNEQGMWNKLNDLQTGKQLTMEEFEKSMGYSPVVKELMRRASRNIRHDNRKNNQNSYFAKSFRNSKRKGAAFLKNIKGVATSVLGEGKELENSSPAETPPKTNKNSSNINSNNNNNNNSKSSSNNNSSKSSSNNNNNNTNNQSQWVDAHQHGKSYKEFTALHLSQEIQAHEGSIWTIRFSADAHLLASSGEDKSIHVWEVQDCEVMSTREAEELSTSGGGGTPFHPAAAVGSNSVRAPLADITSMPSEIKKKGKTNGKKGNNSIPDYVKMPETVLALSEKPVCTFTGHTDEILDLAWSKSQMLLSSSMDKTVRMWDLETKTCLKTFVHNDYVTCIQFNPVDDDHFISGSLDAKIRIWNVPDRKVDDWMDVREMVTAACYTPDGKGVVVGCQEGSCRMYSIDDGKLEHNMDIQKKKKAQAKFSAFQVQAKKPPAAQAGKITGFEFAPWNPSEVLITSADSKIGIYNGSDIIQKFRGYRNTSSQISACFTPDGKHVITASEDSQVYFWKVEEPKNQGESKRRSTITVQAHEHFASKDVTAAVPWPGSMKNEPPLVDLRPKRISKDSKRITASPPPSSAAGASEDSNHAGDSRRGELPPLPKKKNSPALERSNSGGEEELAQTSGNIDPGIGATESFAESSESIRYGDSPSISASNAASPSQTWSSSDGGNGNGNGNGHLIPATAWGMVIVTASLEGEIRVYQNFGLPRKVNRQLF